MAALFHVSVIGTGGSDSHCVISSTDWTARPGREHALLIELPEYKTPNARTIAIYVWEKVKDYLTKAGTTIFLASIVMWFLLNFGTHRHGYRCVPELRGTVIGRCDGAYSGSGGSGTRGSWAVALISGIVRQGSGGVQLLRAVWHQQCQFGPGGCGRWLPDLAAMGFGASKCVCHDAVLSAVHTLCGNHCNDPKGDLFHQMDGWRCDLSVGICLDRSHAVFPDQWTFYRITGIMSVEKRW